MDEQLKMRLEIFFGELFLFVREFLVRLSPSVRILLYIALIGIIPGYFIGYGASYLVHRAANKSSEVTAKASFVEAKPFRQLSEVTLLNAPGGQSAYVRIKNDNIELSVIRGNYTFLFYNAQGSLVAKQSDSFYAVPNQDFYLVVPKFTVKADADRAVRGEITFSDVQWVRRLVLPTVTLSQSPVSVSQTASGPGTVITGRFTNNSQYHIRSIRSVILLYNAQKKIIAVSSRDDLDVLSGKPTTIIQILPGFVSPEGASAEIITTTNLLDRDNLQFDGSGLSR